MTGGLAVGYDANSGGPRSRSRVERLDTTVLGNDNSPIRCPRVLRVALDFGFDNPLVVARGLVSACGYDDEEAARRAVRLPALPCICRVNPSGLVTRIDDLAPDEALFRALVLGLCTPWQYDPRRPLLWTRTSLTRRLELFEGQGFYA